MKALRATELTGVTGEIRFSGNDRERQIYGTSHSFVRSVTFAVSSADIVSVLDTRTVADPFRVVGKSFTFDYVDPISRECERLCWGGPCILLRCVALILQLTLLVVVVRWCVSDRQGFNISVDDALVRFASGESRPPLACSPGTFYDMFAGRCTPCAEGRCVCLQCCQLPSAQRPVSLAFCVRHVGRRGQPRVPAVRVLYVREPGLHGPRSAGRVHQRNQQGLSFSRCAHVAGVRLRSTWSVLCCQLYPPDEATFVDDAGRAIPADRGQTAIQVYVATMVSRSVCLQSLC